MCSANQAIVPGDLFGLPGVMSSADLVMTGPEHSCSACAIAVFCSQGSVVRTDGICQIDAAFWRGGPCGRS